MLVAPLVAKDPDAAPSPFVFRSGMEILRSSRGIGERVELKFRLMKVCALFDALPVGDAAFEYGRVAEAFVPLLDTAKNETGAPVYTKLENVVIYPHHRQYEIALQRIGDDRRLENCLKNAMISNILAADNFSYFRNPADYAEDENFQWIAGVLTEVKERTGLDLTPQVTDLHIVAPQDNLADAQKFLAGHGAYTEAPTNSREMYQSFDRDHLTFPAHFTEAFFEPVPAKRMAAHIYDADVTGWVSMQGQFFVSKTEHFARRLLCALGTRPSLKVNNGPKAGEPSPNAPGNPRGEGTPAGLAA